MGPDGCRLHWGASTDWRTICHVSRCGWYSRDWSGAHDTGGVAPCGSDHGHGRCGWCRSRYVAHGRGGRHVTLPPLLSASSLFCSRGRAVRSIAQHIVQTGFARDTRRAVCCECRSVSGWCECCAAHPRRQCICGSCRAHTQGDQIPRRRGRTERRRHGRHGRWWWDGWRWWYCPR